MGGVSKCLRRATDVPVWAGDGHESLPLCSSPFRGGASKVQRASASQRRPGGRKAGGPGAKGPRGDPGRVTQAARRKA